MLCRGEKNNIVNTFNWNMQIWVKQSHQDESQQFDFFFKEEKKEKISLKHIKYKNMMLHL